MRRVGGPGGVTPPPSPGEGKGVIERIKQIVQRIVSGQFLSPEKPSIQEGGIVGSLEPQLVKIAEGQTEAQRAAFDDDLDEFQRITSKDRPDELLKLDVDGWSVLHYAVEGAIKSGNTEVLDAILSLEPHNIALLMKPDSVGKNPLHLAIEEGRPDLAEKISKKLEGWPRTVFWTARDNEGRAPINHFKSTEDFFEACRPQGLDLFRSPLSIALKTGRSDVLQVFQMQTERYPGWIPEGRHLRLAIEAGDAQVLSHLLEYDRNPFELMVADENGRNPFDYAAQRGDLIMYKTLIQGLAKRSINQLNSGRLKRLLNAQDPQGKRPEDIAEHESVRVLLKAIREGRTGEIGLTLDTIEEWQPPA
jgi:hypothetical protein